MERLLRPDHTGRVLSRRGFLRASSALALGVAAAGLLAACGGDDEDPTATSAAAASTATEPMSEPTATGAVSESTATEAMSEPTVTEAAGESTATEAAMETVVEVELTEWAVTPSVTEAAAGTITFEVTNNGTLPHEFVVLRTELTAEELETTAEGTEVDIEASGELIGTIEESDLPVGATASASFDLAAGHYALICNVIGHHSAGMFIDFEVT